MEKNSANEELQDQLRNWDNAETVKEQRVHLEKKEKRIIELENIIASFPESHETEYDGRMYEICNFCDGQDGDHDHGCYVLSKPRAEIEPEKPIPWCDSSFFHAVKCPFCSKTVKHGGLKQHISAVHGAHKVAELQLFGFKSQG